MKILGKMILGHENDVKNLLKCWFNLLSIKPQT